MGGKFAYRGNEAAGGAVCRAIVAAGWERVADAAEADAVLTYCTSQTALEDAYFDDEGLVQAARPGTLLVDLSPSAPSFSRELAAVATVNDLLAVEAPLAVCNPALPDAFGARGNLRCFVAGEEGAVAQAQPLLKALAGEVRVTGGAGSAQLTRAALTLQEVAQIISAIEADALCRAARRSAASLGGANVRPEGASDLAAQVLSAVDDGRFEGTYTVEMFMAELSAALMAADDAELILPQAEACMHLLELLAVIGGSDKAPAALSLVYGEEAACAENGLDWTRAEQAYGGKSDEDDYDDFGYDDECDGGHGHASGRDAFGYSDYSAN